MPATRGLKETLIRAITPAAEAVCVPEHLVLPGPLPAQPSLGQSCHKQKKKKKSLVLMCAGSLWSCLTLCDPVDCGLPGFSVREGVLQARILDCIGQYWLLYPSRALYFLIPYPSTPPPEYLVLPEPLRPKEQLHHFHTWPSQGHTQALQGSLKSKPQWMTHM